MISELKLETHHVGRYLLARVIKTAHEKLRMMVVIQDESDGAVFMQFCNQEEERDRAAVTILDEGMVLTIKQPYFMILGNRLYLLRVDHVSDLLPLESGDARIPECWYFNKMTRSVPQWKNVGNNAVKEGKYWQAINE